MKTTSEYLHLLHEYYESSAHKYGVTKMALFGSVARGEQQTDSDIDVIYEGQANLFIRIRMKKELENLLGVNVDLIRLRKDIAGSSFEQEVLKDIIYV